jgi:thiosulfate/3-mercaptopyruvate sulfurtransferase
MNTRNIITFSVLLIAFTTSLTLKTHAQSGEPWSAKEIIEPAALAVMIKENSAQKPVIYNIGPLANIKGAKFIGSAKDNANLGKLKQELSHVSKDKIVVIYCGCCPFRNCPNIRPAFLLLKELGFKNPRLLNLSHNLKVDWTDPGYPME